MSQKLRAAPRNPSGKLLARFVAFNRNYRPGLVNQHLRIILMEFIQSRLDPGLPLDFETWLEEMNALFALLDLAAEEYG